MRSTFAEIERRVPDGWIWTLYSGSYPGVRQRAVLVSPDYRIHIGRDGETLEEAFTAAIAAAVGGEKA